jgi:hypothetical protein
LVLHALTAPDPEDFAERVMAPVLRAWFVQVLGHSVASGSD